MEYKKLGQTNLKVSIIGFGGCPISGHGWGNVKDKNSIDAIHKALELGINFFDTADVYGLGHSEEILSKGLEKYRKKVVIATKVGLRWNKKTKKSENDLSTKHIIKAVDTSLKRLRIDRIPLYQIHYPDPKTPIQETMEILEKLKKQGKIQHIGCSNFSKKLITEFQKYGRIESTQESYNILNRKIEKEIIPVCNKLKMGILIYAPLLQGLLTGKYNQKTKFDSNDRRSRNIYKNFHGKRFEANLKIIEKIEKIAEKYNKTCAQLALKWILENPSVTSVIVGVKNPEQITQNIKAIGWKLNNKDKEKINQTVLDMYEKTFKC